MARKLKLSVDHDVCVGNAMCVTIATKAFVLNDERQGTPADPDGDTEELILEAAENCPVAAISVVDADTGEQIFP
ncbi:MAG: ferredoxin [SAR202 cluster bacterium]|nr:ferredoxin [SAR202 cluster bacterium]